VDDALSVDEQLKLTVGFTNVVEPDPLAYSRPCAGGKLECTTANRSTIRGITIRFGSNLALLLVGGEFGDRVRWEISVELSFAFGSPHETSREAFRVTTSSRAAGSY